MATTIILVRHGQTEWNRVERFRGRADIPLNENGLKQAGQVAVRIAAQWQPAAVFTSPLRRAVQTAASIARQVHLKPILGEGLVDIDYGLWQGLAVEEARAQWPDEVALWFSHPGLVAIPAGETLSQVRQRAMSALMRICSLYPDQQVVLVSHTVVNRLILLGVLGLDDDRFWYLRQEPCAINILEYSDGEFTLVSMNDFCHNQ